jgi:Mg-chelatase subunit ChlD
MVMLPIFLVPLVGLAIDGTMLYIVQAKLSSAVDGAALGAGRLLGTAANTTEIAGEFLNVNFPTNYWGTNNLNPTITATNNLGTHTISVNATVSAPLLFLRVLGVPRTTVSAYAQATRKDTRVVLVLDRSGSMIGSSFTNMQAAAKTFTGMFTPGTDELGLVAFSGSAIVAYPTTRPWDPSPTGAGGPDAGFATSSTAGPMFTQINAMAAGGGTNMSEALALAYIELQKTHNRDLAANGVDNSLNSIVLFTDGVPTALSVHPNDSTSNALKASPGSPCTYNPETATASTHMRGYIAANGAIPTASSFLFGMYLLSAYDNSHTLTEFLGNPSYDAVSPNPSNAVAGCAHLNATSGAYLTGLSDLARYPANDFYGTSTVGTAWNLAKAYNGTTSYSPTTVDGYNLALAAWNATDNIGKIIRTQTAMKPVTIYTIGYTPNGGTDAALLRRLANQQDSTSYVAAPAEQTGKYVEVGTPGALAAAFQDIASSLLRLAR